MKRPLVPGTVGTPIARYVPGIATTVVTDDEWIHFSGQVATNSAGLVGPRDIEAQTRQVFGNIADVLASGGATLSDLVSLTIYLVSRDDFPSFTAVRDEILGQADARTTSTVVIVTGLVVPEHLVEVSGVAYRPSPGR